MIPLCLGFGKLLEDEEVSSPDLFPESKDDQDLVVVWDDSGDHQQSN
jgi:hypothetical protein